MSESDQPHHDDDPSPLLHPFHWDGYDALSVVILLFLSVFTRFWIIQYPRHIVSHEEKQIHIINSYLNGSFFIDSEPPFSSLLLAGFAWAADYNLTYTLPRTETNYSYDDMQYVTMRSTPAFAATIVIPVTFFIVRSFNGSLLSALAASLFALFDFLLISLGRHIFTDGYVQLFVSLTVLFSALSTHFQKRSQIWWLFMVLQSLFLGFSVSSKIAAVGLWAFVLVWHRGDFLLLALNFFIPALVFISSFTVHVYLLPIHSRYDEILSESFRKSLVDSLENYRLDHSTLLPRAFEAIWQLFVKRRSVSIKAAKWKKWPLMKGHWHLLWSDLDRTVAAFGNLLVWWPIPVAILSLVVQIVWARRIHSHAQVLAVGYLASLVFFVGGLEERGVCGYEIPLLFGLWAMPLFIDQEASNEIAGFLFTAMIIGAACLFWTWAPLVYGYENFDTRFLPYFAK
jgi:dolichyl-phosphate-mannose--protein O-mannosyl transferase